MWRGESLRPSMTMYSNDTRRWCVKSWWRRIEATSAMGQARSTGMISMRSSWKGLCRLTARWTFVSRRNRSNWGTTPAVETVMRVGDHPNPHSEVSISSARSTLSVLSSGSPMPMKTKFVRRSRSGSEMIWLSISAAVSECCSPCRPVAQKRQPMRHPACDETQSVARSPSGM